MGILISTSMFFRHRAGNDASFSRFRCTIRYLVVLFLMLGLRQAGECQFQQNQRINSLTIQTTADTFAVVNRLWAQVFTPLAVGQLQPILNSRIEAGKVSMILEMPGLTDLTGTNQPSLQIGTVSSFPVLDSENPTTYSGSSDLDWWYTPNASELDVNGEPKNQIPASISASVLNAGPGYITLTPGLLSDSGYMTLSSARVMANIGSSSKPLESANGFPPGHLPSENTDTTLVSFASMSGGRLKGNISAASLANTPIPASLLGTGTDQNYGPSNSMLDLIVGGATTLGGIVRIANPAQPDQVDPNVPAPGAGPLYTFSIGAGKKVTSAKDKDGNPVNLDSALNAAAYSAYFTFTTDRVIVPTPKTLSLGISSSWNLISVPLTVRNLAAHALFPAATSKAFAYNNTYLQRDTLANGVGYWLKFPGPATDTIIGQRITMDTIPVGAGWNLVGSISSPIAVSAVQSIPPGMITSHFFGYLGTYTVADTIQPGKGYWVKVTGSGSLVLSGSGAASQMRPGVSGRIRIVPTTELPPPPPDAPSAVSQLPKSFVLEQNYPNPFNPVTRIEYSLPQRTFVRLVISDVLGREIATPVSEYEDAGKKFIDFNASTLPSGLYFFRIQAGEFSAVKKMILLK